MVNLGLEHLIIFAVIAIGCVCSYIYLSIHSGERYVRVFDGGKLHYLGPSKLHVPHMPQKYSSSNKVNETPKPGPPINTTDILLSSLANNSFPNIIHNEQNETPDKTNSWSDGKQALVHFGPVIDIGFLHMRKSGGKFRVKLYH